MGVAACFAPCRALYVRRLEVFQAQRCTALRASYNNGRAGCPGSRAASELETLQRMTVNSSFKSCAAAAATAHARLACVIRSTPYNTRGASGNPSSEMAISLKINQLMQRK